jgi:hydrogenase-4 component F
MFQSEFTILRAGFNGGHIAPATICIGFLVTIFAGFLIHFSRLVLGPSQADDESGSGIANEPCPWKKYSLIGLASIVVILAFWVPGPLFELIREAATVASGER